MSRIHLFIGSLSLFLCFLTITRGDGTAAHWVFTNSADATTFLANEGNWAPLIKKGNGAKLVADSPDSPPAVEKAAGSLSFDSTLGGALHGSEPDKGLMFGQRQPFTIEAWFQLRRLSSSDVPRHLISTRGTANGHSGWAIFVDKEGVVHAVTKGRGQGEWASISSEKKISPGTWNHVAAVREASGQLRLYLNGNLEGFSSAKNAAHLITDAPLVVGGADYLKSSDSMWDGMISEVRITGKRLDTPELLFSYKQPVAKNGVGLELLPPWHSSATSHVAVFHPGEEVVLRRLLRTHATADRAVEWTQVALSAELYDIRGKVLARPPVALSQSSSEVLAEIRLAAPSLGWFGIRLTAKDEHGDLPVWKLIEDPRAAIDDFHDLSFVVVPDHSSSAIKNSSFGVDTAITTSRFIPHEMQVELAKKLGVRWVRERFSWGNISPAPNTFHPDRYLEVCKLLSDEGLLVTQAFHDSPEWIAKPNGRGFPSDLLEAYRFFRKLSGAFEGRVHAWELWNEQDATDFGNGTPDQYTAFAKAASLGVRAGNPNATVLFGGMARDPRVEGFAEIVGLNEAGAYFDGYNFHNYRRFVRGARDGDFWLANDLHREAAKTMGLGGKPIWLTETGTPFTVAQPLSQSAGRLAAVSYLANAYLYSFESGISPVFWFLLRGHYGQNPARQFGLVTSDLSPMPTYAALSAMSYLLEDADYKGSLKLSKGSLLVFETSRGEVAAVVGADQERTLIPRLSRDAAVFDYAGNRLPKISSGAHDVIEDAGPIVYITGMSWGGLAKPPANQASARPTYNQNIVLLAEAPWRLVDADRERLLPNYRDTFNIPRWAPRYYRIKEGRSETVTLKVYNLGSTTARVRLTPHPTAGIRCTLLADSVEVGPMDHATVEMRIEALSGGAPEPTSDIIISGTTDGHPISQYGMRWKRN